jgi:thioredoxin reductase (NADPH)
MVMLEDVKAQPKLEAIIQKEGPLFDLIIIGGGPAGLTAAIYAGRARLKTLLVEKALLGGLASTTYLLENYPGFPEGLTGIEMGNKLEAQARKFGCDIYYGEATGIKIEKAKKIVDVEKYKLETKAIILATGTQPKKLGLKGEEELRGRGVSYCATCDGPFYRDKNIVVVGGGNAAIEESLFLTRYASKITVVHRRDKLRADKILAERALNHPKIFILWNSEVEEIVGRERVEQVVVKNIKTQTKSKLLTDGVFFYVGSSPNSGLVKGLVKLDENGYILTDEELRTNVPGIFAAGDIRKKSLKQVVTAAADGALAADSARRYIEE